MNTNNMKLAEALVLRADYQKRIDQLKARVLRNAKVQDGDRPAEAPAELVAQIEEIAAALERLVQRINRTNAVTRLDGAVTVADMLARRDMLAARRIRRARAGCDGHAGSLQQVRGQVQEHRECREDAETRGRAGEGVPRAGRPASVGQLDD